VSTQRFIPEETEEQIHETNFGDYYSVWEWKTVSESTGLPIQYALFCHETGEEILVVAGIASADVTWADKFGGHTRSVPAKTYREAMKIAHESAKTN
jgi:hypothetical protein